MDGKIANQNFFLSIGYNKYVLKDNKKDWTVHAEIDSINKLPPRRGIKRPRKIDIIILRFLRNGELGESRPCIQCLNTMYNKALTKGYQIMDIHYSTIDGDIICKKYNKILQEKDQHISSGNKKITKK